MTETFSKKDNDKKSVVLVEYQEKVYGQLVLLLKKIKVKWRKKQIRI